MLLRSCACQMSQCSAVQSVSERRACGRGVSGSVGSSSVVCSWQMCGDVGSAELGGSPVWSGHIRIGSIHSMGGWQLD